MIIYRTSGPWGAGAGANLSASQVDGNFYDVTERVKNLELHPPKPIEITSFTAAGDRLYIYMSDGSVQGPLILPAVRWFFRGAWTPATTYNKDDVVTGPDQAVYLVTFQHISSAVFEPAAADGLGNSFYSLLLKIPGNTIPAGGGRGFVLTKASANNFDVIWDDIPAPAGGNAGEILQKASDGDGDAYWGSIGLSRLSDVTTGGEIHGDYLRWDGSVNQWVNHEGTLLTVQKNTSWAPVVGDNSVFMVITNGTTDTTIFIPTHGDEPFGIGTELHVHQDGTGRVSIVGDTGVTIRRHASFSNQLLGQYATASVKKTDFNEWRLFGLLAGA